MALKKRKKPKYPNRVYSTKASALRAKLRYGGKGLFPVNTSLMKGRSLKGFGIKW